MKSLIIGDLHLDLWTEAGRDPFAALSAAEWSRIEAVVIAGDLTNKPRIRWNTRFGTSLGILIRGGCM